jgi:cysteine desulfurase
LLSISGHKIYGPKGVGALYVRGGFGHSGLSRLCFGGPQEFGFRPGTENVPAIVGLGVATQICLERMPAERLRTSQLRDRLEDLIQASLPDARINGAIDRRLPGATSITLPYVDAEALMGNVPWLSISATAACSSGTWRTSHVLNAIGLSPTQAAGTLRLSVGRFTTLNDIEKAGRDIAVTAMRLMRSTESPQTPSGP